MSSIRKTAALFLTAACVLILIDLVGRGLLRLDCLGPVLPGWGCLFAPLPASLVGAAGQSRSVTAYAAIAAGAWLACHATMGILLPLAARAARRLFPRWMATFDEPPGKRRTYRAR